MYKMKVLIIRNYPSYMDVVNNTYNIQEVGLAKALVRRGNVCDIVLWTDKEEQDMEVPVEIGGKVTIYYRHGKTALKNTVYSGCKELFEKYDILQPCEYNQIQSWILAKKYPEKTFIFHGPYYSPFNKRYNLMCSVFDKIFLRRYIKLGTKFIVKSNLAKKFLIKKGIKPDCIFETGVGIDVQMLSTKNEQCYESLYTQMNKDGDILKILYIGRFEERRNIPFIMKVFAEVLKKQPDAKLYMIGNGEKEYLSEIWKLSKALNIDGSLVYQKKMPQRYLSEIYKMADVFLLPTEYEIFGMVLLEAMYYGNIVITTDNGGSSTLIQDGVNGYIRGTEDRGAWASLILKLFNDKAQATAIAKKASLTVGGNYTWDKLAEKFEKYYSMQIKKGKKTNGNWGA